MNPGEWRERKKLNNWNIILNTYINLWLYYRYINPVSESNSGFLHGAEWTIDRKTQKCAGVSCEYIGNLLPPNRLQQESVWWVLNALLQKEQGTHQNLNVWIEKELQNFEKFSP